MKLRDIALLFLLASIWGASFLFIRVAVHDFGAPTLVAVRVLLAAVVLIAIVTFMRQPTQLKAHWRKFLFLGAVNSALPFTMIATAELNLTASFAAILNATTPLFAAIVSWLWLKDPLTSRKLMGLALGLVGVTIVVGWSPFELTSPVLLSIGMMFIASFAYGTGTVYSKKAFVGVPTFTMAIGQQLGAGIIMLPLAFASPPTQVPSTGATIALLALAIVCTAFAYLIYFTLVRNVGATNTSTVTMLVPFFGILWGALFLNETIGVGQLVGFGVILFSLSLVTGINPFAQKKVVPVAVASGAD